MTPLERSAEEFCSRSEVAPATRRFYRDALRAFLPWAEEGGLREPADISPAVAESYAKDLEERRTRQGLPLALASRRAYLRGLRQYLSWLSKHRGLAVDHRTVPMPRPRRTHRDVLTPAEMQQLEDAAPIERDKLIVRVMVETGAREGEVQSIQIADLIERDRRFHYLAVRGKTGSRLAPITPGLYRRLKEYAEGKAGRPKTSSPYLFMAHRRSNGGDYQPLSQGGVYQVVKDAGERSGLRKRIYPHLLRHSRITALVASGTNMVTISEVVGVSVEVIARAYSHQSDEQRHAAMMKILEG